MWLVYQQQNCKLCTSCKKNENVPHPVFIKKRYTLWFKSDTDKCPHCKFLKFCIILKCTFTNLVYVGREIPTTNPNQ